MQNAIQLFRYKIDTFFVLSADIQYCSFSILLLGWATCIMHIQPSSKSVIQQWNSRPTALRIMANSHLRRGRDLTQPSSTVQPG